jgi:hypothetical protein
MLAVFCGISIVTSAHTSFLKPRSCTTFMQMSSTYSIRSSLLVGVPVAGFLPDDFFSSWLARRIDWRRTSRFRASIAMPTTCL